MPFVSDIKFLKSQNVCGVVNLCYEYPGPSAALYSEHQIRQLHLPTLDIHEPTLDHMKKAVSWIDQQLLHFTSTEDRPVIFIHCKGGRGRAVITTLCYFISKGLTIQESFQKIKSNRSVASEAVISSKVVKDFETWIKTESIQIPQRTN
jgi:protein-tyrosine phosphatase